MKLIKFLIKEWIILSSILALGTTAYILYHLIRGTL
ncbi:hypothetical protein LCGC14_1300650 [marine sediment metagenome]|uniref:Uncharacterized protein n=1 Tax=marine sediment metagenome TaxID=412755 RepID=A0A0F9NSP8_9ZZZZ